MSRGDQILNAQSFLRQGFSYVLPEETAEHSFLQMVRKTYLQRQKLIVAMKDSSLLNGIEKVLQVIDDFKKS